MRVAVTGAAGFLGSHVADVLASLGHEVTVIDLKPSTRHRSVTADITDGDGLARAFSGAEGICHLAAIGDVYAAERDAASAARVNVEGTAVASRAAAQAGAHAFVYASTWEVYGTPRYQPLDEQHPCDPVNPYAITKLAGERLALTAGHMHGVRACSLRLGTAYGTRMRSNSVFSIFIDKARRGEPITLQGTGEQTRQFTHASDIGRAFAAALDRGQATAVYNVVSTEITTIKRLAALVIERYPTALEYAPARALEVPSALVSSQRAKDELGWSAECSFADGMLELLGAPS